MKDQWEDPEFAREWDETISRTNPTRAEQLELLVSLLEATHRDGAALLDLGIGSGLVEALIFPRLPDARVVGVDASPAMLSLATKRLAEFASHCQLIAHDFSDIEGMALPPLAYRVVISVQALHHLPHGRKQAIFQFAARLLPPGGLVLLIDRIALEGDMFSDLYRATWNRLERSSEVKSGLSGDDFLEQLQYKDDYPATLDEHLGWLRSAGFSATCLHLHLNRALIAGVKTSDARVEMG
jgi:cyclopropane fatty-acyl-phospholipid synthase-like methyltransferase